MFKFVAQPTNFFPNGFKKTSLAIGSNLSFKIQNFYSSITANNEKNNSEEMLSSSQRRTAQSQQTLLPSHFTGRSTFYETLALLKDISKKLDIFTPKVTIEQQEKQKNENEEPTYTWLDREAMEKKFSMSSLTNAEYSSLVKILSDISNKQLNAKQSDVFVLLNSFSKGNTGFMGLSSTAADSPSVESVDNSSSSSSALHKEKENEKVNRVISSLGYRKTAKAQCWLYPGTGEMLVNGRPLTEYFVRLKDLYRISLPFEVTDRFGKYNVWALTNGGGPTGQADAVMMALAKALAKEEPALATLLNKSGLTVRDLRIVERKKPGQPKARKKFTWVKR